MIRESNRAIRVDSVQSWYESSADLEGSLNQGVYPESDRLVPSHKFIFIPHKKEPILNLLK